MSENIPPPPGIPKRDKKEHGPAVRWTPKLAQNGWTPIVDDFLENYAKLVPQITPMEALLVIHLMQYKWSKDAPYPGFAKLAENMGLTPTSVRNHARSLQKKGYLVREIRVSQTNRFHLQPLFRRLEAHVAANPKKPKAPKFDISAFI